MNLLRSAIVLLAATAFVACDDPIPESNCDLCPGECVEGECIVPDATDDSGADASDATADASADAAEDAEPDVAPDAEPDVAPDAAADAPEDVEPDGEGDATPDVEPDATEDVEPDAPETISVEITAPRDAFIGETGLDVVFSARVDLGSYEADDVTVTWESDADGVIYEGTVDDEGLTEFTTSDLGVGIHSITVTVAAAEDVSVSDSVDIGICGWLDAATFDEGLPEEWETYGDAVRDPRGWLEMTGSARDRAGAIANVGRSVASGDVRLRFRVSTGQCDAIGPCPPTGVEGADGFALSIFEVPDVDTLEAVIAAAQAGGGLGYGIAGGWGSWTGDPVEAFHIEFDTWYNIYNGSTEFHTDPTRENHIGITLNGNPGDHVAWAEAPTLEDNDWHDIEVNIEGTHVVVLMDGVTVIDEDVPGLVFKGGYVVFTGSTGWFYNFHRFDDLQVIEDCRFE